jgi:L-alanine-DL-glutamate epimerase-like enolase superfamily enzyme
MAVRAQAVVEDVDVQAFRIPTDAPEADGTLDWSSTTLVVVRVRGGGRHGLGYTYADRATAAVIHDTLIPVVKGADAMQPRATHGTMLRAIRNLGRGGIAAMAVSAVDVALWDLAARIAELPLAAMLGPARKGIAAYGSGGFTSYSSERLCEQLAGWVEAGMKRVKMKVGRDAAKDRERVALARGAIGRADLFVDANGAYSMREALGQASSFADHDVRWFEEPVSSDDLVGLHAVREHAPPWMDIAAGEYGYDPIYFRRMLDAESVDVLQADATRCGGATGFLQVDALCDARGVPLSAHCAPHLHAHLACASSRAVHVEYFHDHARIEQMLFEGACAPVDGALRPDWSRAGLGIELKERDARRFSI